MTLPDPNTIVKAWDTGMTGAALRDANAVCYLICMPLSHWSSCYDENCERCVIAYLPSPFPFPISLDIWRGVRKWMPLCSKEETVDPVWALPWLHLKDWGKDDFFCLHLSLHPLLPSMPLVYSHNGCAQRKLTKYAQCRCRSECKARDTVKQQEKLRNEISEFIILGSSKLTSS